MRRSLLQLMAMIVLEGLFLLALTMAPVKAQPGNGLLGLGRKSFLGGRFVWSDEVIYQNWRVQKHAVVGHYQLLDPDNRRQAIGSLERCLEELDKAKVEKPLPPLPKHVVIVAHGLGASRKWMVPISKYLEDEGNLAVVNFGYPSTMGSIDQHAQSLVNVIRHLEGVETISFVAHSMGNIVIRHCLNDLASLPASEQPQITYKRFVMIAPPNHGAVAADKLGDNPLVKLVGGKAIEQLAQGKGWESLEQRLVTPSFPFGIIVGGTGDEEGYLGAIPGDDDTLLSVETSKLAGATDFIQVRGIHQTLPREDQVQQYTLRFLQAGAFLPSGRRQPIVATR